MSEQIQHMQRLQLTGTLAGGIAHDLNNELTLVLGNLEIALDRLPDSFDAFDSLELARTAASRCADMSRRLLYLGREKRTVLTRMDVADAIAEARLMLECVKPANTRLTAGSEAGLFILGDSTEIQQVLINLGTNAFQSMKNGGDVEIRGYMEEGRVNVLVKDNGCGMTASLRKRVYEPFFTTRADAGGSGLGLSTVRSIMTSHGGLVGLDTTPGEGTTFLLNFPTYVEELAPELV
jgi:two-component system cell cycle sensor histidine kinase/response regulator CckA